MDLSFFNGKRVFITGHTGFKGTWLCRILANAGAQITGYALPPNGQPDFFSISGVDAQIQSVLGDIREPEPLLEAVKAARPEIVIHMAAQPLVRDSYVRPAYTYETNVMGTVHILECVRKVGGIKSFLNVTTDKVYQNNEWVWGYRETEPLDGHDPYSNSKSCSELVTHSYAASFFAGQGAAISTARAGNVIGGGDFSTDRIIPDCARAAFEGSVVSVRNPDSTRPYQHVLEPLFAYLLILIKQAENPNLAGWYNVGPDQDGCASTGKLADLFCAAWGEGLRWQQIEQNGPHEAGYLKLDCSKIKDALGWRPVFTLDEAVKKTVDWYRAWRDSSDVQQLMDQQIEDYLEKAWF